MAAPAAAPAGEAVYLTVGLAAVATYVVLLGLSKGYDYSLGALLNLLANQLGKVRLVGGILSGPIDALNHLVKNALADGLSRSETVLGKWWHGQVWVVHQLADALDTFSHDTYSTIYNLTTATIPAVAGRAAKGIGDDLAAFRRATRATVDAELQRFARGIDGLRIDIQHEATARLRGIDQLGGTLRGRLDAALDRLRGEVAAANRYARGALTHRVHGLEKALGASVLAGAALATLTRAFPFWRCTNVRNLGRGVCRMDPSLLEDLLLGTLAIGGLLSVRTFARELRDVEHVVAGFIFKGVRETSHLNLPG